MVAEAGGWTCAPADPATHSLASTRFSIPRPRKRTSGSSCSRNNDDDKAWEAVVRSGGSDGTERELMPEPSAACACGLCSKLNTVLGSSDLGVAGRRSSLFG